MFFQGSFVALITLFDKQNDVDYLSLEKLINWHLQEGTNGIVILGTTAESTSLTDDEKKQVINLTCKVVQKKIPIIVGTGTNSTHQSVQNTKVAKQLGADACLVIVPYYNLPEQAGIVLHYQKIADVGLPVIIYHHPKRTGAVLSFETLLELEKHPNIVAIKDASGDAFWLEKIIKETSLKLLSGNDENTFELMCKKATGSISVIANLAPYDWALMHKLIIDGKIEKAKVICDKYQQILHALTLETNPQCVKYALSLLKKDCLANFRLPLIKPSLSSQKLIKEALDQTFSIGNIA